MEGGKDACAATSVGCRNRSVSDLRLRRFVETRLIVYVPSLGALTSKVFSSAHFFCALACSFKSVSRLAVAMLVSDGDADTEVAPTRAIGILYRRL